MENISNNNWQNFTYLIINESKDIISFNLTDLHGFKLSLDKSPQIGQSIVDIFPQEHAIYFENNIQKCLDGDNVIIDGAIAGQIVKSSIKVQIILISLPINEILTYAVCFVIPQSEKRDNSPHHHDFSRFTSHDLRAPVSNILSLSNYDNYAQLDTSDGIKIKELLKNIYHQAEKLNNIITILNELINKDKCFFDESIINGKITANHVVLVDDDPLVNMIHKKLLIKHQSKTLIQAFDNPEQALNYITVHQPDLVLLDINMPEINGWNFLDELKNLPFKTKVIIVSSSIDPMERAKSFTYDTVIGFVNKPLTHRIIENIFTNNN